MLCSSCLTEVPEASDECESVVCGWCAQMRVLDYELDLALIASQYPPERLRLARKARKLTQEGLAYKINIPKHIVAQFETGKIDCPTEIQKWIDENESPT